METDKFRVHQVGSIRILASDIAKINTTLINK